MLPLDIVRAWKDPDYRLTMNDQDQAALPQHPAGMMELSDEALQEALGAQNYQPDTGFLCVSTVLACATAAFSCWPGCDRTVVGTCKWYTAGCC
jgi:mersacidin/lichenicidin family type 2 lantibiotic